MSSIKRPSPPRHQKRKVSSHVRSVNNVITGIGSVLDIAPARTSVTVSAPKHRSDMQALRSDWNRVKQNVSVASKRVMGDDTVAKVRDESRRIKGQS